MARTSWVRLVVFSTLLGLGVIVYDATSSLSQQPTQVSPAVFMRLKLQPAKDILEGIALGNFDTIRKNSEEIRKLALDESWMVIQTDDYRRMSREFERSMVLLSRAAEEKNLDGATLAYMQMTLQCVQCHRTIRDPQKAGR